MYADDLSIYAAVNNYEDYLKLQYDLNELCTWAERWCLNINYDKCKVIHFGHANKAVNYKLNDTLIKSSNNKKLLGVVIDSNFSFKEHIHAYVKKGYGISYLISSNLRNLQCYAQVNLHKCYVRPTLEYNSFIFLPHNIFLIDVLGNVQRYFTKHLPGLCNFDYVERLKIYKLESLELRKIKCDVIMLFKILHGMIHVDLCNNVIAVFNAVTRSNNYKIVKHRVRLDVR